MCLLSRIMKTICMNIIRWRDASVSISFYWITHASLYLHGFIAARFGVEQFFHPLNFGKWCHKSLELQYFLEKIKSKEQSMWHVSNFHSISLKINDFIRFTIISVSYVRPPHYKTKWDTIERMRQFFVAFTCSWV